MLFHLDFLFSLTKSIWYYLTRSVIETHLYILNNLVSGYHFNAEERWICKWYDVTVLKGGKDKTGRRQRRKESKRGKTFTYLSHKNF